MAEFEELLQESPLPDLADLDLDLPSYVRILASILDVPVYNQITESLHVIFTLYSEFKTNQHFANADTGNFNPNPTAGAQGQAPATATAAAVAQAAHALTESMAPSRAPSPAGR